MERCRQPELMDDPALDEDLHRRALRALWQVNRVLGVDQSLHDAARQVAGENIESLLDLGTGVGGFLAHMAGREGDGDGLLLVGLDISTFALALARRWTHEDARGVAADARTIPLADDSIDVVVCSLLLHHFDEDDVIAILREAARVARRGVVFGDLTRSRTAYALTWLVTHVTSRSPIYRTDGPRSVRAAYRNSELAQLADRAGLAGHRIRRHFPFRMILTWSKNGAR
jgi:ubiquinone/menaquinone biosynthesis C-methylase UbiE